MFIMDISYLLITVDILAKWLDSARVDLNDFSNVTVLDLTQTDANLVGFTAGLMNDDNGYFVPYSYSKVAPISLM